MCVCDDNVHDQDFALIHTQLRLDRFLNERHLRVGGNIEGVGGLKDVSGIVGDIGGFAECVSEIVGGIGGFSGSQEEMEEGICGGEG